MEGNGLGRSTNPIGHKRAGRDLKPIIIKQVIILRKEEQDYECTNEIDQRAPHRSDTQV